MEAPTVRTQIQLTEQQARLAKQQAAERGVSMAEFIRAALDGALQSGAPSPTRNERVSRALEAAGRFHSGSGDGSARHDDHLTEAYLP